MKVDRDVIVVPEVVVEDVSEDADWVLQEVFDMMWNAGGWAGSPHYGEDGRWLYSWSG